MSSTAFELLGTLNSLMASNGLLPREMSMQPFAVYSFDGLLVFGLLFICTCAYLKKVPRLNKWLLSEKKGVWGVFYKAAVIGTRLHVPVALSCLVMGVYVLFIK
ncbi:protein kish-B [Rhincodon typus]|uniref:protein kish-B n=1 Tax=Rhincodon typus TaxID=259920 RepID=UPI00202DF4DB|nr:protein kish-B [Rhincodon typus]